MLGRGVVSSLGLYQRSLGGIQIAARDRALGKKLFAALHDAQIQIEIGFGLCHVQLGLLCILRHLRPGCRGVGRFGSHVAALVVLRRRG